MTIILITSAAYVGTELEAEYGRLPPSFLPVGHRRLYELQHEALFQSDEVIYLTVPASYRVPAADIARLSALNLNVVPIADGLTLGNSVLHALSLIGSLSEPIKILHGDTLIYEIPHGDFDIIATGERPEAYDWGEIKDKGSSTNLNETMSVLAGYFAFSEAVELRRALVLAQGEFIRSLEFYQQNVDLRRWPVKNWLDFGHLQTFYRSRCQVRTQRTFNELSVSFKSVEKKSHQKDKISAEAHWYKNLPDPLKLYTPAFLGSREGSDQFSYSIEYLPLPSLHELFVFGDIGHLGWKRILESCFFFLEDCLNEGQREPLTDLVSSISALSQEKTEQRLSIFADATRISLDEEWRYEGKPLPSLRRLSSIATAAIDDHDRRLLGIMHGDFCFTNIFYDFRTQRIRVIDPRGTIDGKAPSIKGDLRYDLAKLSHSISGGYDFILANRFSCEGFAQRDLSLRFPADNPMRRIGDIAARHSLRGFSPGDPQITALTIHLFLSMLPLHHDRPDRQKAFLANALRLFALGLDGR